MLQRSEQRTLTLVAGRHQSSRPNSGGAGKARNEANTGADRMMQRKLTNYLREEQAQTAGAGLLKKPKKLAAKFTMQHTLLWYIYVRSRTTFRELYKAYRFLSG